MATPSAVVRCSNAYIPSAFRGRQQRERIWSHVRAGGLPAPVSGSVKTPFGAVSWPQLYEGTGVPLLRASPLLLPS
ncbi:MAG: hypothetical protein GIW94_11785 [Candidatus Eremiobacteraeota bacterium]|nr:hypothetical protein [Candidatus Eremiobacteraeota bacterium]MBC5822380.1 hypothetical protein [Candidatus Eremiobacteraeota bacterium]